MGVLGYNSRVLVDEFDFSDDTKAVKVTRAIKALERKNLQSAAAKLLPGMPTGAIALKGYWVGDGAGTIEKEIEDRLGTTDACIVTAWLDTRTVGTPAYMIQTAWADQMEIDAPLDDLLTLDSNWVGSMRRGYAMCHDTLDATGAQTGVDFAAAGVAGGWFVAHVRAIAGTIEDATITVQSASSLAFTSPTTHATITINAVGAQLTTFTGAIGRYLRVNLTSLGGADSIDISAFVGVSGVTGL